MIKQKLQAAKRKKMNHELTLMDTNICADGANKRIVFIRVHPWFQSFCRFALILLSLFVFTFGSTALAAEAKLDFGGAAPGFSLKSDKGKKITLRQFRGKNTVILAFWLPNYAPVLEELEKLRSALKDKRFKDVRVLTITRGKDEKEKRDAVNAFKKRKLDFPILWDEDYKVSLAYEFYRPGFFIINREGVLSSALISSVTYPIRDMPFDRILEKIAAGGKVDILQFHPRASVEPYAEMIGNSLPDFMLMDLDRIEQAPAFYRGFKKLIVVFWRYNCSHCRKELPLLQNFYKKYREELNFEILAVTGAENKEVVSAVESTVRIEGVTFPVALDPSGASLETYHAERVPLFYIADTGGAVREVFTGEVPFLEKTFVSILKGMDAEKGKSGK